MRLFGGDKRRQGTHYRDRMNRIIGTCHSLGILWREQRSEYHGQVETYRQQLVTAGDEVTLTPQYEKYPLRVNPAVLAKIRGMGAQFAFALNVPAVRVEVEGDTVYIAVPRGEASAGLTFTDAWALAPDLQPGALLLGQCDDGAQAALDMTGANVHAACIGMTGSGKTTLLRTMALSVEMEHSGRLVLCDPVKRGFWPLSGHPVVLFGGMFADPREIERVLQILAQRVHTGEDGPLVYVFVDEVPELVRQRPRIAEYLGAIAAGGRHAGHHLILGAQTALVSALGELTVKNLPAVLLGKVRSAQDSYSATGRAEMGGELLRGGGDFIAVTAAGVSHFQAAQPEAELLAQWAGRYPPSYGRLPVVATTEGKKRAEGVPAPTFVRAQSVASLGAAASVEPSPGAIGRPSEEPSRRCVCWAASEWKAKGQPPTLTQIYELTRRWYRHGYGRPKARRVLEAARELLGGAL